MGYWYYYEPEPGAFLCDNCFEILPGVEANSADMVLIDPPYGMAKVREWDSFGGREDYMAFMGRAFREAERILKLNGTLGFWHNDLRKIGWLCNWIETHTALRLTTWGVWVKPNHRRKVWASPGPDNTLRSWFNITEFCIFFVKAGKGPAWNRTGLELTRLDVEAFGGLRDYFRRLQSWIGETKKAIIERCGQSADHCFRWGSSQWTMPTRETYNNIIETYRLTDWPEYRTFESLEAEAAETLAGYRQRIAEANAARFTHNLGENHCNVWISQEAQGGRKLHPCQKPVDIIERILETHTNPGGLVVDFFAGSGSTGVAAVRTGRRYLLIEQNQKTQAAGAAWVEAEKAKLHLSAKTE